MRKYIIKHTVYHDVTYIHEAEADDLNAASDAYFDGRSTYITTEIRKRVQIAGVGVHGTVRIGEKTGPTEFTDKEDELLVL